MPNIGYGTWNRPGQLAYNGVATALAAGYRHVDCAEGYEHEEYVGRAIADAGPTRDDLWVTTKVTPESFGPGQIRPHVEATLDKLGVGLVDLPLLHCPSINNDHLVNEKRTRRLTRLTGLRPIYQKLNTSKAAKGHCIYPYL